MAAATGRHENCAATAERVKTCDTESPSAPCVRERIARDFAPSQTSFRSHDSLLRSPPVSGNHRQPSQ